MLQGCKLLVRDESTMSHKRATEALNRTHQDLRDSTDIMGGMVVLLAGDFRQTLPVIQRGTPADAIQVCIESSSLWSLKLKIQFENEYETRDIFITTWIRGLYAGMLLKIDDGCLDVDHKGYISLSRESFNSVENHVDLIAHVFQELQRNLSSDQWLYARAILAPKSEVVNRINTAILKGVQGDIKEYLSMNTIMDTDLSTSYPVEFLNSLELSGVPSDKL
ncbi:hypothetical protein EVAR_4558_1 [Eumeta japonica]|uniref:ATP-dependent DNA helicase n=1 Tax=Eumeta variegata TaxID=151549 RepID=A0A4C1SYQ8_EUMVA|nr:hypothetical protein EVAR_4558_1 [Eumeta japonica]